jgi:uncharacterized integral membrane protein
MRSDAGATPDPQSSRRTDATLSDAPEVASKQTRISAAWVAITAGLATLMVVLVFALQNLQSVEVTFLSLHWHLPLAVLLLLVAALGGVVVFAFGAARIVQLKMQARHRRSR